MDKDADENAVYVSCEILFFETIIEYVMSRQT